MSKYYNAARTRNLFDPASTKPYKLSRSKIELFLECPRCFYLDRRLGTGRPPGFPFNLNSAVDSLLKNEFDAHRLRQKSHPLMDLFGIDAVPFQHHRMDEWRDTFRGVQYLHKPTNLLITGAVDDIWVNPDKELIVVDYKATSKAGKVTLEAEWQNGYKRQMEVYQWLLRRNEYTVSDTGYFVYCNGRADEDAFDGKLEFDIDVLPYTGNDSWVKEALADILACLRESDLPAAGSNCDYCAYRLAAEKAASATATPAQPSLL